MNATEKETFTLFGEIIVPPKRGVEEYIREHIPETRDPRVQRVECEQLAVYRDGGSRRIKVTLHYRTPEETPEETTEETTERGVPNGVLAAAESEYQRCHHVARIAVECYREARDKVTKLRKRRRAYEARQLIETGRETEFARHANDALRKIANGLGIPAHILRDAQSSTGSGSARQVGDWPRYRPDPAAGEPGTSSEV